MFKIMTMLTSILMSGFCFVSFAKTVQYAKPFEQFIVYRDKGLATHYTPSGYMPTGECLKMNEAWTQNCKEGKSCIQFISDRVCSVKNQQWVGMYWLSPANNWGEHKGGYDLTGAKRLVFWARGEKGGEVVNQFKIGGVGVNDKFPDSDTAGIGPVVLSKHWQKYSIDLAGKDLSYISGGFAWVASMEFNPDPYTFLLDDIYFE